jgi:hypothetical protein
LIAFACIESEFEEYKSQDDLCYVGVIIAKIISTTITIVDEFN